MNKLWGWSIPQLNLKLFRRLRSECNSLRLWSQWQGLAFFLWVSYSVFLFTLKKEQAKLIALCQYGESTDSVSYVLRLILTWREISAWLRNYIFRIRFVNEIMVRWWLKKAIQMTCTDNLRRYWRMVASILGASDPSQNSLLARRSCQIMRRSCQKIGLLQMLNHSWVFSIQGTCLTSVNEKC